MSNIKKLYLISLLSGMTFYTPIMTLFLLQQNIELGFLVAAQSAFSIAMMAGEMPTGILADKFGQIFSIRIGLLLDAFGMLQLLLVQSNAALIAYFLVRGLSVAFRSGSDEAFLYDSWVAEKGSSHGYSKAYGKYLSNEIVGFVIATALAGIGVQLFGQASFVPLIILTGLSTLVALGITYTLKICKSVAKKVEELNPIAHLKQSLGMVKKNRTIMALTLAGVLTLSGEYFLRQSYQPYFQDMAVPAIFLGAALSIGKILNLVVIKNSHILERFLTVDRIILVTNAALGLSFVGLAVAKSPVFLVGFFIVAQALFNADRPIVSDYINQKVESFQRSTVLSAVSFLKNVTEVFTRLILAASIGIIGISSTFILQGAYLVIGAIIGAWYLRSCGCVHKVKQHQEDPEQLAAIT